MDFNKTNQAYMVAGIYKWEQIKIFLRFYEIDWI